jgi:leucyl-tRNA synthetase
MPGWAGSCWYYLRYCDPHNDERFTSKEADAQWMGEGGVDLYVGGAEHAVLHLLYARFWHHVLHDLGHVGSAEPFRKLFHQGLILSHGYQRADKKLVPSNEVENRGTVELPRWVEIACGEELTQIVTKMSKSLKNVVNPDDIIAGYGADTFRLYEMYMGPLETSKPWNTRDILGMQRFLQRAWRLMIDEQTGDIRKNDKRDETVERQLHRTIASVTKDIDRMAFNTAIARMIELVNVATQAGGMTQDQIKRFTLVLSPFVPHMAEEIWCKLGLAAPVAHQSWPTWDEDQLVDATIEIPIQVKGKVRSRLQVPRDIDKESLEKLALADERVQKWLEGKTIRRVVVVPGRLVNIVAT